MDRFQGASASHPDLVRTTRVPRQVDASVPDAPASLVPTAVRWAAVGLLLAQLGLMLAFSEVEYRRFCLTKDFATYSQAWWAISHGHLDPTSTVLGLPFWRNNAELVLWPLSLLHLLDPHPLVLLWVQDLCVVATEAVALTWVSRVVERSRLGSLPATLLVGWSAVALAADPWAWETIAFDFHPHTLAALFSTLLGFDLWSGRRRCWVWVPLALVCCVPASLYVVGAGAAGIFGSGNRTRRWRGAGVASCGLAWLLTAGALGAAGLGGRGLQLWYGYLAGPGSAHLGAAGIAVGIAAHPVAVARLVYPRVPIIVGFLVAVGLVGVLSVWGLFPALAVIVPSALNSSPLFLRFPASFQTWPALPFVLVGTASVLAGAYPRAGGVRRLAVGAASLWVTVAVILAAEVLPGLAPDWISVSVPAARLLATARERIPPGAEVIADNGIIGRFAERSDVRLAGPGYVPVDRARVVFVLAGGVGVADPGPSQTAAEVGSLRRAGAEVTAAGYGVVVLAWTPPRRTRRILLP